WYERFADHMRLDPLDLAMSYITRSERVDADRLRAMSPRFMAVYSGAGAGKSTSREGRSMR
ncbi:MAG: FAD-dependent monooxygenase, partial [Solimonas sp.]